MAIILGMAQQEDFNSILKAFKIKAQCVGHRRVRNISLYDCTLSIGTKIKDLTQYLDEISITLKAYSRPLLKIVPQQGIVRLEVVDGEPERLPLFENMKKLSRQSGLLPLYLGSSVSGENVVFDIAKNPHMLVAGTTGSGKSVFLHTIIGNLLSYPDVKTILVDPKNIEFISYKGLRDVEVYNTLDETVQCIENLIEEMNARYSFIEKNKLPPSYFLTDQESHQKIVLIIDEFADLVSNDDAKRLHKLICKLAQKSRASAIFCILSTQRPSVQVINGEIKANFPARVSFKVSSHVDSRVILDAVGSEHLVGSGDAIVNNYLYNYQRFLAAYTTPEEIVSIYKHSA
jgi:S-DNA-T family DNA segregation ATPase FtsK/SpoIIIE